MSIAVTCPNGHRLMCAPEQAGRSGKCPSCGAVFKIDALPKAQAAAASPSTAKPVAASPPQNRIVVDTGAPLPPGDKRTLVFLCPNGHRLRGTPDLEGQAGTCPQCQARFLVPAPDEFDESDSLDPREGVLPADSSLRSSGKGSAVANASSPRDSASDADDELVDSRERAHPMAEIFRQLWPAKAGGAIIEIHLENSTIVVPDAYSENASCGDLAVFSIRELDGAHTVTVIPWRSMTQVAARRLAELPEGMFDEPA